MTPIPRIFGPSAQSVQSAAKTLCSTSKKSQPQGFGALRARNETRAEGSMKTLENVEELAIYASACCNEEVLFERNDWFSFCPACERLCFWLYVEPVVSWIELQEQELFTA